MNEMTIEELHECAQKYFTEVIAIMKTTIDGSAEYDSHVEDLESLSKKMSEDSFGYLKLKVVY